MSIEDFIIKDGVLETYLGQDEILRIPEGVVSVTSESIGKYPKNIKEIHCPHSLRHIGERFACACTNLEMIYMQPGLESIGYYAFAGLRKIRYIVIPKSVKTLGREIINDEVRAIFICGTYADTHDWHKEWDKRIRDSQIFREVEETPEIICNETYLIYNGTMLWFDCNVQEMIIPEGITEIIKRYSAGGANVTLERVTLPEGLTRIGESMFQGCTALNDIHFPSTLRRIGDRAFGYCPSLKAIDFPNGFIQIGAGAFQDCSAIEELTLPGSLETISDCAFMDCTNIRTIDMQDGVEYIGKQAFAFVSQVTKIDFPYTIKVIDEDAFYGCASLERITFSYALEHISMSAFEMCQKLVDVEDLDLCKVVHPGAFIGTLFDIQRYGHWIMKDNSTSKMWSNNCIGVSIDGNAENSLTGGFLIPDCKLSLLTFEDSIREMPFHYLLKAGQGLHASVYKDKFINYFKRKVELIRFPKAFARANKHYDGEIFFDYQWMDAIEISDKVHGLNWGNLIIADFIYVNGRPYYLAKEIFKQIEIGNIPVEDDLRQSAYLNYVSNLMNYPIHDKTKLILSIVMFTFHRNLRDDELCIFTDYLIRNEQLISSVEVVDYISENGFKEQFLSAFTAYKSQVPASIEIEPEEQLLDVTDMPVDEDLYGPVMLRIKAKEETLHRIYFLLMKSFDFSIDIKPNGAMDEIIRKVTSGNGGLDYLDIRFLIQVPYFDPAGNLINPDARHLQAIRNRFPEIKMRGMIITGRHQYHPFIANSNTEILYGKELNWPCSDWSSEDELIPPPPAWWDTDSPNPDNMSAAESNYYYTVFGREDILC